MNKIKCSIRIHWILRALIPATYTKVLDRLLCNDEANLALVVAVSFIDFGLSIEVDTACGHSSLPSNLRFTATSGCLVLSHAADDTCVTLDAFDCCVIVKENKDRQKGQNYTPLCKSMEYIIIFWRNYHTINAWFVKISNAKFSVLWKCF